MTKDNKRLLAREQFEKWANNNPHSGFKFDLRRDTDENDNDNGYHSHVTIFAWWGYQAALANQADDHLADVRKVIEHEIELKHFRIIRNYPAKGGVWITRINGDADGEGGWFDLDQFEKIVEKFYERYF